MFKRTSVLFFIVLLLFTTANIASVHADGPYYIYIDENSDFASYAVSGDGSVENPYLINYIGEYSYSGAVVYIENTDAHAIIDSFLIDGDSSGYGMYLNNVANINITNGIMNNQRNGMLIKDSSNILISNVDITHYDNEFTVGIRIDHCDNLMVEYCYFVGMQDGIQLWDSFRVSIHDNEFVQTGLSYLGTKHVSTGVVVRDNIVNGLPLGYLFNAHDMRIDVSGYGQAILVSCTNVTIYNGDFNNVRNGVQFIFCLNSRLEYSEVSEAFYGVLFYESYYCSMYRNNITDSKYGVVGYFAVGTIIYENNILNNYLGLWAYYGCSSSMIYLNNFIGNTYNARDDGGKENSDVIWLTGRFINRNSGWPLVNVSVHIERAGIGFDFYTNEDGLIKVPVPMTGIYDITVSKFRYEPIVTTMDVTGDVFYNVEMDKANLGPGTGYVQMRFMDGVLPVEAAEVRVYSYLDGGYYFHSNYTTGIGGAIAGWVNISGLYYDNYTVLVRHPSYEDKIIQQIVISDGFIGSYPNIQMVAAPTSAFIYGHVYDAYNRVSLEGVNITMYAMLNETMINNQTIFTDSEGFYNMTNIERGTYNVIISLTDYRTLYKGISVGDYGSYVYNPVDLYLVPEDYSPLSETSAVVNNWDNEKDGNYWDDFGGEFALASTNEYQIPGDNPDDPVDEYPLAEPYVGEDAVHVTPSVTIPTDDIIPPLPTAQPPEFDYTLIVVGMCCAGVIALVVVFMSRKRG